MIMAWHRSSETSRRLDDCPGVGPALATAPVATVADPKAFQSGRNFSAWIGLVPKQPSPVNCSLRRTKKPHRKIWVILRARTIHWGYDMKEMKK